MSSIECYWQEAFVSTQNDKLSNAVIGEEQENKSRQVIVYTKEQVNQAKEVIKLHQSLIYINIF
jgi:hypothetical protein